LVGKDTDVLAAAVIHHAAVHDAGGFLKRAFRIGPGYTYAHDAMGWYDWMSASCQGLRQDDDSLGRCAVARSVARTSVGHLPFGINCSPTVRRD
jgi:hypothetical protein